MQEKRDIRGADKPIFATVAEFFRTLWGDSSRANDRLLAAIKGVAFGLAAFFLGGCELAFSTYPLGIALLCAADRHVLFILAGLVASALGLPSGAPVALAACLATAVIRVCTRLLLDTVRSESPETYPKSGEGAALRLADFWGKLFCESVWLRMSTSAVAAFCLSLYSVIAGGFRYYDLFGALFAMAVAPLATFIYAGYFDGELKKTALHGAGILALLVSLTFALRNFTLFGVYGGAFVAFFATLCAGRRKGMVMGCLFGACLGLAFDPIYAPLFVLGAAAAGVLWNISPLAAATAGCVAGMIWGVYVNGLAALSELLPALLCGTMIFGAADRLSLITSTPELIRTKADGRAAVEALICEMRLDSSEQDMRRLSSMFAELGEAFHNLSDRLRRPAALDLRRMCDSVCDEFCPSCPKRELCWGVEYSETLGVLNRLSADLHSKNRAEIESLPEYLRMRCPSLPQMIEKINESCARLTEQDLLCDRTGVFAADYEGISRILTEAIEAGREDYTVDDEASAALSECLKKLRFGFDGVLVYGGRRRSVAVRGLDSSRARIGVDELRDAMSEAVGVRLGELKIVPVGTRCDLTAGAERRFKAGQYTCSLSASGEEGRSRVCGDTVNEFSSQTDKYYALLSDGMGSGREAALTSRICSLFLEKMLKAGNRCETSLKLLNSFMSEHDGRARSECSASVDLMELDLLSG